MEEKKYIDYYPNRTAKLNGFHKHLKDKERFNNYCNGKNEYVYEDEGNYGWKRNNTHLTNDQRLYREYLWNDFGHWEKWQQSGRNIFDFSTELLDRLKHTDVADVNLENIKLPYTNFYLDISNANIPFANDYAPIIEGVFITEEYNETIDSDVSYERVISFSFTGEYLNTFRHINDKLYNHVRGFHQYSLFLDKPYNLLTVQHAVQDAKEMFLNVNTWEDHDDDSKIDLYTVHADFIDRTINLMVNCLLYLSLKDRDVIEKYTSDLPIHLKTKVEKATTNRKREVAYSEINHFGFTKIKYVGSSIVSLKNYDSNTGNILPHWRRGHWRKQKFGEQLSQSKLIWIMPTIVNNDKGDPVKGHLYNAR